MEKSSFKKTSQAEIHFDPVVLHVIRESKNYRSVKMVEIFGSRARGDHGPKFDYDFVMTWNDSFGESWGDYTGKLRERSPTLHQLDLVRKDTASEELLAKIAAEGIVIYDQDH